MEFQSDDQLKMNTSIMYELLLSHSFTIENPVLIQILTDILKKLFFIGNKSFKMSILNLVK